MGWTGQHATHYKNGRVDRKAECDAYWLEGCNKGYYSVVKSAMVGSTYYAAIKALMRKNKEGVLEPIPESEQKTFGVVFLTTVDSRSYYNFNYKDIDESCGPAQSDCPSSIIRLLSETDDEWALKWRKRCLENEEKRKEARKQKVVLNNLPAGTVIEFQSKYDFESGVRIGDTVHLTKIQMWGDKYIWHDGRYRWKPTWISEEYKIVS